MKKTIILCALMALTAINANAQLEVYSNGNASVKSSSEFTMNNLSIGLDISPSIYSGYKNGVHSRQILNSGIHNIAVYGDASISSYLGSGRAIGVLGSAGYSTNGYNYGVFGSLISSQNGAGIYGTTSQNMGDYVNGRYAGYFYGPTYVNGTLTATSVVTPSDTRLKERIIPICDTERGSTLENVLGMNVIEYSYKQREIPETERDTTNARSVETATQKDRHFGLSAQELQAIYPNLVKEGQDGYLGVNYVELVPVLIRAIQELKGELDAVKSSNGNVKRAPVATGVNTAIGSGNVLYQNTPNPFKEQTTIRFSLADDTQSASICIFDMTGKMLKNIPVSTGDTSVSLNGWELGEGLYLYSLIVNGREIDTKKMLIKQ